MQCKLPLYKWPILNCKILILSTFFHTAHKDEIPGRKMERINKALAEMENKRNQNLVSNQVRLKIKFKTSRSLINTSKIISTPELYSCRLLDE